MSILQRLFGTPESTTSAIRCFDCRKPLAEISGGGFGNPFDIGGAVLSSPYRCKSCGTAFCVDCMLRMKKGSRLCTHCHGDVGW